MTLEEPLVDQVCEPVKVCAKSVVQSLVNKHICEERDGSVHQKSESFKGFPHQTVARIIRREAWVIIFQGVDPNKKDVGKSILGPLHRIEEGDGRFLIKC